MNLNTEKYPDFCGKVMGHDWRRPHDKMSNTGMHSLKKHWKTAYEKANVLGNNRWIWNAQNLFMYAQLAECSAESRPSHRKTIWRIAEENAYELLTKMFCVILKLFKQYTDVCVCVYTIQVHRCIRMCMRL
jgi:hypothetical protein